MVQTPSPVINVGGSNDHRVRLVPLINIDFVGGEGGKKKDLIRAPKKNIIHVFSKR